ncbi:MULTISPECIES: SDR family oxidoreductase [Amycolatopsis]|uniref:SDR family NAD(P)-dependent oxidoreductase n=1 Tax=Amycolatopsis dongchuanensis TaxID=1070866 RepID=A0ABP9R7F0_9PSEU|nr:SDR family oxidoreductase [Amycolatopsis sacchari]
MTGGKYRTAIVTGVSRGLGLAIANALCSRGMNVVGASRTQPEDQTKFDWVRTDISRPEDVNSLFSHVRTKYGDVDVLVNNAAGGRVEPFEQADPEDFKKLIDVNLTGQILCAHAAIRGMVAAKRGLIVNIGSDWGRRYAPRASVYAATKFGLLGFSGSLLREVKDHGVKVCCVMPGGIDTSWGGRRAESSGDSWSLMPPEDLAQVVTGLLDMPPHMVVHEILVHPMGQAQF